MYNSRAGAHQQFKPARTTKRWTHRSVYMKTCTHSSLQLKNPRLPTFPLSSALRTKKVGRSTRRFFSWHLFSSTTSWRCCFHLGDERRLPCPSSRTCNASSPIPISPRPCRWLDTLRANPRPRAVEPSTGSHIGSVDGGPQCTCLSFPKRQHFHSFRDGRIWEISLLDRLLLQVADLHRLECPPSCPRPLAKWSAVRE